MVNTKFKIEVDSGPMDELCRQEEIYTGNSLLTNMLYFLKKEESEPNTAFLSRFYKAEPVWWYTPIILNTWEMKDDCGPWLALEKSPDPI
jgi:hypothetical protein